MNNLLLSFSGGETSAFMTKYCLDNISHKYDNVKVVFANTGQEHEKTLKFINACDKNFGFEVIWVEAVINKQHRKGTKHKVVSYETADRHGGVYEKMIEKYGIPNKSYPHCTRELKLQPITSYLRSIGWKKNSYDTAIGIRADEIHRISSKVDTERIIYPLIEYFPMTKEKINDWWSKQGFRLDIPGYLGNCTWCWKKSEKKLGLVYKHDNSIFNFPRRMEYEHGKYADGNPRFFFRGNKSTENIIELIKSELELSSDYNGCSDSCEVFN